MATFVNFVIAVLVSTVVLELTTAFILDTHPCPAYKPCTCSSGDIYCQSQTLLTIPKFYPTNIKGSNIYLYLYSNQLTTIPSDSFRNLTVSRDTKMFLNINNNNLNSIATNAFRGIRDTTLDLDLDYNNFTALPSELASLTSIEGLHLQNNPITSLNPSTMRQLGRSLRDLYLDLNFFNGWPVELNLLTSLERLYVRYLNNNTNLEHNTFDGFANSLTILSIQNSQLKKVPAAVCQLHKLKQLEYNNNADFNGPVFEPCLRPLSSVITVYMQYNMLRDMPDIFGSFPSITNLYLNNNKLSLIQSNAIPSDVPLSHLNLANNDITVIPSVINNLNGLTTLNLEYNKITAIGESDLNNLSLLQNLYLNGNPIDSIASNAFKSNLALYTIYLRDSNLRHLPSSLAALQNLRHLYLDGSPIECSCNMSFLKALDATRISMDGSCKSSSIQIKTYITDTLPKCT